MRNPHIGVVGVICAVVLAVAAVVLWVQDEDAEKASRRASEPAPKAEGSSVDRNDRIARKADTTAREITDSTERLAAPPTEETPESPRLPAKEFGPEPDSGPPSMPNDHPLALGFPGWLPQSGVDEAAVLPEVSGNSDADFVGLGADALSRFQAKHKRVYTFDPSDPDGVLELDLTALTFQGEYDKSVRYEVVIIRASDRKSWRIKQTEDYAVDLFIPVAAGDTFQVQLRTDDGRTALGYLPIPGASPHFGGTFGTRDLYRRGIVHFKLRLTAPDQQPRARGIQVADAAGKPVADAVILQGGQEFGRANAAGVIDWPFPPPTPNNVGKVMLHERGFMLSAPGYVPVFLPRGEVADSQQAPLQIILKAREFVASVWGGTIDDRFMCLAPNTFSDNWYDNSEILALGWDLLPLEPGAQVASWEDAFYYLAFNGYGREKLARIRKLFPENNYQSVGRDRRRPRARPFFNGSSTRWSSRSVSWPDGLEAAVGRPYHDLWTDFYGGWYNGRWRYDAGRFDVVLPYPGKFLLLVGEEFREGMTGSKPGQINHVLYINALDPANVKGELFRCPN